MEKSWEIRFILFLPLWRGKKEGFIISAELSNRGGLKTSEVFRKKFYNMLNISFNWSGFIKEVIVLQVSSFKKS